MSHIFKAVFKGKLIATGNAVRLAEQLFAGGLSKRAVIVACSKAVNNPKPVTCGGVRIVHVQPVVVNVKGE